ncbi:hypothetical protein CP556_22055 [Natrinema sp. CBA1119]|uniref:DUF7282 domain-containing protein n=1 Tax=Natrinema sp. CBA1119 TaxID=1608465 RepID=UPI000BF9E9F5|nr:hypothetical protein [Natrinema sp. CBA1119]PGF14373.1 hypothetical protein CP556_22055 [Natrinema sp. CBA1119]
MGDACVLCVSDTDRGISRIENVWIGDGAAYEEKGGTGLWVEPAHTGHLVIEGVNIQEMSDNAFYCSAMGAGGGGTVSLRNCYAADCWVSHYRLAEGRLENCVASVTDCRRYRQGRGVWAWAPGPVEVENCHLDMNGNHYSFVAGANDDPSHITVTDTQWDDGFHGGWAERDGSTIEFTAGNGTDPHNQLPDGCPASPVDIFPQEAVDLSFEGHVSTGETVIVERAVYHPDDFVIVIATESGDVIGASDQLTAGETVFDLSIPLESELTETQTVTATIYTATSDGGVGDPVQSAGRVRDTAELTIIREDEPYLLTYMNEHCVVDTTGLKSAITAWRNGTVSLDLLRTVIDYWRSSEPLRLPASYDYD